MLNALSSYLYEDYRVISIDFQELGNESFRSENSFSLEFASCFLDEFCLEDYKSSIQLENAVSKLSNTVENNDKKLQLRTLFKMLISICSASQKPIVLIIDEVDSATNNQVFLDFLAQLRNYYLKRISKNIATFQSVILAGVYDIKNLKQKYHKNDDSKTSSQSQTCLAWNIAADFDVIMSFSKEGIAGMLREYETDYHTGMDIDEKSSLIYHYTSGYPFLVSRLCKLIDEKVSKLEHFETKASVWTKKGFLEAERIILSEKNTLFESLINKLTYHKELNTMLSTLLFTGKNIAYNSDNETIDIAAMFGFIENQQGIVAIANRILETRLYNLYLSASNMQNLDIYKSSLQDMNQSIIGEHLNMRRILEKFVVHFNDLDSDNDEAYVENEGRKYFLLYLRPIINGTGNYYIESRTRGLRRTDVIVDYHGEQYIIEMKIWHGTEYNNRGEEQLLDYLDYYHKDKGYMISFNFNKKKQIGS